MRNLVRVLLGVVSVLWVTMGLFLCAKSRDGPGFIIGVLLISLGFLTSSLMLDIIKTERSAS